MAREKVNTEYGPGELTNEHAASSYGIPVVVVDGVAYGPAEIGSVDTRTLGPGDEDIAELVEAARAAGYQVHC